MGTMVTRALREFTSEDIAKVANSFKEFREGSFDNEAGFCAAVDLEGVAKQDFILTPGRYVGIAETEEDDEPYEEKMQRLTSELGKLFEESNKLQEQIRKNMEAIGFGF